MMRSSRRVLVWVSLMAVVAALTFGSGRSDADQTKPVQLRTATMFLGSSWYVYGASIAALLHKAFPKGSSFDILPFAGAVGNMKLLQQGDADLALGFTAMAKWAHRGEHAYKTPMRDLRGLIGAMDNYYLGVVVRADANVNSVDQIVEEKKPLSWMTVPVGGGGEFTTRRLMAAYGFGYDDLRKWGGRVQNTGFGAIRAQMKDGRGQILTHVITAGHPSVTEIAVSARLKFLPLREDVIAALEKEGYRRAILPAGTFRGQDQDVPTVGLHTNLVARASLPDEVAYRITKAVCENTKKLGRAHASFKRFSCKKAWTPDALGVPIHPGAARYYKEKGYMP
ncbi:MAG: TAXI family TRAP transporter solute-binding subunit [Alphaproteobacteria bacterium]